MAQVDQVDDAAVEAPHPAPARSKWWQWFFLYPAFGVAFLTAVPDWIDKGRELWLDLRGVSIEEAQELQAFMQRNWECTQSPHLWVTTPSQTSVDGTICPKTGDVFLRIMSKDNNVYLKGISIDKLVAPKPQQQAMLSLVGAAEAATLPNQTLPKTPMPGVKKVQQLAITICQKWIDDRKFTKRIKVGGQCYDEVFDSYTGQRLSSDPAPCNDNC